MKGGEKHEMTSLPLLVPAPIEIGAGTVKGLFSGNGATARSGLLRSAAGSAFGSLLSARLANLTGTVTSPRASAKAGSTNVDLANATPTTSDALAQLTAQLQNGTPLSTIVDRLASIVASFAPNGAAASATDGGKLTGDRTLKDSIARALSPPANAPPGSAAQEAAALAARLQQVLTGIAREAEQTAGQQSDISGPVLDADTARELPAQQLPPPLSNSFDSASLTQLLLSVAAASLQQHAQPSAPTAQTPTTASPSAETNAATAPDSSATQNPTTTGALTPGATTDLLARVLARAASVDQRVNALPPTAEGAKNGASSPPTSNVGASSVANSPNATFVSRFETALAQIAIRQLATASDGGSDSSEFGRRFSDAQSSSTSSTDSSASSSALGVPAQPVLPFASQLAAAPAGTGAHVVDADAVLEQVLKAISLRTTTPGTSEIRLQLSPANLGEVAVKLTVTGTTVTATALAQNADVRNVLVTNHHQLSRALEDAGLKLSGFSVDVSGGDAGREQQRDRTAGFGRHFTVHELHGRSDESDSSASSQAIPSIVAGSSLELFNYLV